MNEGIESGDVGHSYKWESSSKSASAGAERSVSKRTGPGSSPGISSDHLSVRGMGGFTTVDDTFFVCVLSFFVSAL